MARGRGSVSVSVEIALDQAAASHEKMRSSAFQRLMATKINEEMATQLPDHLTAHEFLACGYGHDIGKYARVGNASLPLDSGRRHRLPSSPRKRMAKYETCSTTTLPRHKTGWDWSKARVYGTIPKGIYGDTTF